MISKFGMVVALGASLAAGAALTTTAQAMPVNGLSANAVNASPIEQTQFFLFGGRHYCFYLDGWHGPGWYWCGYAHRRGYGWGGPEGWHGWHHGHHGAPHHYYHHPMAPHHYHHH